MSAPPSAKAVLADEAKFNEMTAAAYAKAGGGDSIDKKAILEGMRALHKEQGGAEPSEAQREEGKKKFGEAAAAVGLSMEGSASLEEFRADMKKIFTKLAEAE